MSVRQLEALQRNRWQQGPLQCVVLVLESSMLPWLQRHQAAAAVLAAAAAAAAAATAAFVAAYLRPFPARCSFGGGRPPLRDP